MADSGSLRPYVAEDYIFHIGDKKYYFNANFDTNRPPPISGEEKNEMYNIYTEVEHIKKVGTYDGVVYSYQYATIQEARKNTKLQLNSYTMDDGTRLPILTGGTYDENGYFTKSS